jgi:hypothetical protein
MKKAQMIALAKSCNVNLNMIDKNFILMVKVIEQETIHNCVNICEQVYKRSIKEWKDDNHRYNLGYAHGADECIFQMSGKTLIK